MLQSCVNQTHQLLRLPDVTSSEKCRPRNCQTHLYSVQFVLFVGSVGSRRRWLPFRQSIGLIIHDNIKKTGVASEGVHQMPKTDRVSVTISACGDNGQRRIGNRHTGGRRQYSSVQCVVTVTTNVVLNRARTTDASQDHCLVRCKRVILERYFQGRLNAKMTAT